MKPSEIIAQKANEQAQAVFEQGREAMDAGNPQEAKRLFEAALSVHPNNFDSVHFLGILHAQAGLPMQALPYFKKAAELNPAMAAVYNNMALTLDDLERFDEAIANYDRAISLDSNYEQAKANRQNTLAKQNANTATKLA